MAGVRTIPALSRIRATSANRPVCNAWGWEFHWGWGFRVNKQCGGLGGWRAPSPWGLARPFVAFNPSTLYWKAWGGAWLRLARQLLCVLEFLTDCLHTLGNNTVIPHPQGGWQEWQVRPLLGSLRPAWQNDLIAFPKAFCYGLHMWHGWLFCDLVTFYRPYTCILLIWQLWMC